MTKKMYQIIVLLPGEYTMSPEEYIPVLQGFQRNRIHDLQWKACHAGLNEPVNIFLKNGDIFKIKYGKLSEKELIDTLCPGE